MITWIMVIWEWFLKKCESELESEPLQMEDLAVQPYSIGRFSVTVLVKI